MGNYQHGDLFSIIITRRKDSWWWMPAASIMSDTFGIYLLSLGPDPLNQGKVWWKMLWLTTVASMPWVKAQMMGDFNTKILQRTQTIGMWSESSRYKDWVCVTCLMYILRLLYPNPIYSKQDQPINSVVLVAQACVKKHLFEACRGQVACSSWLRCNKNSMYHEPSGKMKQKPWEVWWFISVSDVASWVESWSLAAASCGWPNFHS